LSYGSVVTGSGGVVLDVKECHELGPETTIKLGTTVCDYREWETVQFENVLEEGKCSFLSSGNMSETN